MHETSRPTAGHPNSHSHSLPIPNVGELVARSCRAHGAQPAVTSAARSISYAELEQRLHATPLRAVTRHLLGLYNGLSGARAFRRLLSDAAALKQAGPELLHHALQLVEREYQLYEQSEFQD